MTLTYAAVHTSYSKISVVPCDLSPFQSVVATVCVHASIARQVSTSEVQSAFESVCT